MPLIGTGATAGEPGAGDGLGVGLGGVGVGVGAGAGVGDGGVGAGVVVVGGVGLGEVVLRPAFPPQPIRNVSAESTAKTTYRPIVRGIWSP